MDRRRFLITSTVAAIAGPAALERVMQRRSMANVGIQLFSLPRVSGGADPVALLSANPGRYQSMHVKDMTERKRFRGDGGDAGQWMEMFPYMTTAGDGVMPLPAIIAAARAAGMKHFFVEQDLVAHPEIALKRSFDYVRTL